MTIQMTALTHTANSISVNDIYSYHSPSQIDNRQIDSKQINNSQVDRCLANDINPTAQTATIHTATIHKTTTRAISEVIIPSFNDSNTVVSTIIASLTQQNSDRWTTWITSTVPNKALLSSLGACLSRLRIVYIQPEDDARWVIWQALAQGNSHNVIAEQTAFSSSDIQRMEVAANQGECKGMLISCTQH